MTKVTIKNFQSIGSVDFNINGFTVIVGKNNIGKSAVIRAIDSAMTNQAGKEYIRKGTTSTEVQIKRDDLDINWKKGDSTTYVVNGKSYSKLNRTVPQPILDAGFGKLEIGDLKLSLMVAHQFDELFLLDKPGSVITEFLSALYNLDTYTLADDLCQKDARGCKSLLKTRESDLKDLQEKLNKYSDLEAIKKLMVQITDLDKTCNNLRQQILEIREYENQVADLTEQVKTLQGITDIKIPGLSKIEKTIEEYRWLSEQEKSVQNSEKIVGRLQGITQIKIPDYPESLYTEVQQIQSYDELIREGAKKLKAYKNLPQIDINSAQSLLQNFETLSRDFLDVKQIEEQFRSSVTLTRDCRDELKTVTEQLAEAEKSLPQSCPLCGNKI